MIRSRTHPLIRLARNLRQRKSRDETGLFLVEGIHHVGEALAALWQVDSILYAPERLKSDFGLGLISKYSALAHEVSSEALEFAAGKDNPQGILAIVH